MFKQSLVPENIGEAARSLHAGHRLAGQLNLPRDDSPFDNPIVSAYKHGIYYNGP